MSRSRQRATYDDLRRVPDPLVAEIVEGVLYTNPRPALRHARAAWRIGLDLDVFDEGSSRPGSLGGWWFLFEPELHLGDDVLVPDLAAWRRERLPALPDTAAATLAPDWVCEVSSPATTTLDRTRKMPAYARAGVASLWLVDPIARVLEMLRLAAGVWVRIGVHRGGGTLRAEPFAAIAIDVGRWWPADAAPAP